MCGISGVAGFKNIGIPLLDSIRHLEYRGYDSCGIAILGSHGIEVRKNIGSVDEVNERERLSEPDGKLGIAHTRWATHGGVTKENTHPHLSCKGDFALVHNGIISNYQELKKELIKEGHKFHSETDTEVIVHLVEKYFAPSKNSVRHAHDAVEKAFIKAIKRLEGTYAVAMVTIHEKDKIFCAKKESPLVIGIGGDTNYIGSDFNAFIDYTKNAVVLDDDEYAIVSKDRYFIKNTANGETVRKKITEIHWDSDMAKKGGYPHYMLKEIYEQPQCIINALQVDKLLIKKISDMIIESKKTYLIGVGTTYYVSLMGEYQFSSVAGIFTPAISSDEFKNLAHIDKDTLVIALSQSGETYDTLNALKYAKNKGAKTAAIVNVMGSSIARLADHTILQGSGPEICVISTKAALSQMIILLMVAIEIAVRNKKLTVKNKNEVERHISHLPEIIQRVLNEKSGFIHTIAQKYSHINNWLYLGRGKYYPIALESSLKMKEVAYVHAEGMPAGFLKHGTIALIDENLYSIMFMPPKSDEDLYRLSSGSAEEIKARKGFIIGFHFGDKRESEKLFNEEIVLPKVPDIIAPFLELVVAQLFAYFTAVALKRNIDKPRSLAKSVTVA
ncbi:MAG: glutamine--fructose-6-phosphate aminotransferase [Nitrospinae bacterium RIFCSPLOWO2_01_FULL_39_10]|nr:MAG: glutamine--fructose-6-phosphate aminotransferase [Nitrospinae bacterium RIFCSPLOWO2_01_FULL_39_10]